MYFKYYIPVEDNADRVKKYHIQQWLREQHKYLVKIHIIHNVCFTG